ncbi:MAG: tyrosine-protein phosphatase [Anaerolineae bacterium]
MMVPPALRAIRSEGRTSASAALRAGRGSLKTAAWLALPVALAAAGASLYSLYLRRARASMRRIDPESLIQPDRRPFDAELHLEGVANARDLGGYRTADGRRVRRGMIYRSGDLSAATDNDLERLQALDVQLIVDLRHDGETDVAPDRLPPGAAYVRLPFNESDSKLKQVAEVVAHLSHMEEVLLHIYSGLVFDTGAPKLGALLRELATDDRALPVLIHCSAGKDRTGITAAVLLSVLGVPDEAIYADYTLSNRYYSAFYEGTSRHATFGWNLGLVTDDLHPLLLADPATLQAIFAHIRVRYGSIEGYLAECADVDETTLDQLRARLLEPDDEESA